MIIKDFKGEYEITMGNPDMNTISIFNIKEKSLMVCDVDTWKNIKLIIDDMIQVSKNNELRPCDIYIMK
jgi:hypothetical protein